MSTRCQYWAMKRFVRLSVRCMYVLHSCLSVSVGRCFFSLCLCIILMSSYVNSVNRRVLSVGQTSTRASQMWTDIKYDVFFSWAFEEFSRIFPNTTSMIRWTRSQSVVALFVWLWWSDYSIPYTHWNPIDPNNPRGIKLHPFTLLPPVSGTWIIGERSAPVFCPTAINPGTPY